MSTIYLVRHGITPANKENRFAGRTDEELHAEGREQIHQVGMQLLDKNIAAVYCGPARRTIQSAEIIGSILNVSVNSLQEFDEINIPHWDGLTKNEIRQKFNGEYPAWLETPEAFQVPGCENLLQVQARAVNGVQWLLAKHRPQNLLLVSHLIVLRCLVLYCRGLPIRDFRSIKIDNGSVFELSESGERGIAVNYPE